MSLTITNNTSDILFEWSNGMSDLVSKTHITNCILRNSSAKKDMLIVNTSREATRFNRSEISFEYDEVTSPVTTSAAQLRNLIMSYVSTISTQSASDTFVNGDLAAGVLTITHNLGTTNVLIAVKDNNGIVTTYTATVVDANSCTINLAAVAPITGTWTWMAFKA